MQSTPINLIYFAGRETPGRGISRHQSALKRPFIAILKMAKHNPDLPLPVRKASAVNIPLRTY
jgi:hypothetical protein